MKPTKKSEDDSLLQWAKVKWNNENLSNEKMQIFIWLILAVSNITTTVAPLTHPWQRRQKKTYCLFHFQVVNLKNFSMNPAVMGSQEQTMMQSH